MEANRTRQHTLAQERLAQRRALRDQKEAMKQIFDYEAIEKFIVGIEEEEEVELDANGKLIFQNSGSFMDANF